jgi:hypothetical protein
MRLSCMILLLTLSGPSTAFAQATAAQAVPAANVTELPVVTVSGVQPGPGLWKVSRGDHVMWVLGTLSPLPQRMQWQSRELEEVISHSQQVLLQPSIKVKANVGFVGKLFLLPAAYSARKNDDGATLQQVLPPPLYARWQTLKQKYIGDDRAIERWRPLFAAEALYKKAIKANDLSKSGGVKAHVDALATKYGVPETPVDYQVVIEKPRAAIKAFKLAGPNDLQCFSRTLDSVEQDMPAMTARANAWATGDLAALRQLPDSDRHNVCVAAVSAAGFAHASGLDDVPARQRALWLTTARAALAEHAQTFALLPMDELLKTDGYLAALQAGGYQVESPEDQDEAPASDSSVDSPASTSTSPE